MLKWFIAKLQALGAEKRVMDPSCFQDPIAMQTGWTPARSGGASFRTHTLVEIDSNRIEFKASVGAMAFYSLFIIMGISTCAVFLSQDLSDPLSVIVPTLFGSIFVIVGGCMLYFGSAPIVFDKYQGAYWKGWKKPENMYSGKAQKNFSRLTEIHALQLISEHCRSNKSSFYSYELNLVLNNGIRLTVVDHGNPERLREDAQTLSRFLGKPVWDAI